MKTWILSAFALISMGAAAQMKEGRIVYERVQQLPFRALDVDPEIAAQMPKSRTESYELLFSNNQSFYGMLPTANNEGGDATFSSGGMVVRTMGGSVNNVSFFDFSKGTKVERRELMDKEFNIADSIRKAEWKLSDETKTVMNYTVRKATTTRVQPNRRMSMENGEMKMQVTNDTVPVVAWFTTDIPVPVGPEYGGQLPGAILELDINNGLVVYKATEVAQKVNTSKIKEPKGKKITPAEFEKEQEKFREEMRKNFGNGNRSIRIQQ